MIRYNQSPQELISENAKIDYGRLRSLIAKNKKILEYIISEEKIESEIVTKFSFEMLYDENYFISLLFYLGMLTIDKQVRSRLSLRIPNYVIKEVLWSYFAQKIKEENNLTTI